MNNLNRSTIILNLKPIEMEALNIQIKDNKQEPFIKCLLLTQGGKSYWEIQDGFISDFCDILLDLKEYANHLSEFKERGE